MGSILGFVLACLIVFALVTVTDQLCRRHAALDRHRKLLRLLALAWCAVVGIKMLVVNEIIHTGDARGHERFARQIADLLNSGNYEEAWQRFGMGNYGYRFVLGVFYFLTDAPEYVTLLINGALAFTGLLSLVDVLCRSLKVTRIPAWLLVVVCASPSALFWATSNLKEAAMLWAICMVLRGVLLLEEERFSWSFLAPLAGLGVGLFFRPHIILAWAAAVFIALAIIKRRPAMIVAAAGSMVVGFLCLQIMVPEETNKLREVGMINALETVVYDNVHDYGGSAITYRGGTPTPIVSGLLLLFFRPYPWEVFSPDSLMAGTEVWVLSGLTLLAWYQTKRRKALANLPLMLASIIAVIGLSLFFSYMYNMGLMVRQRLQVFPAQIALLAVPVLYLAHQRATKRAASTLNRLRRPKRLLQATELATSSRQQANQVA